MITPQIQLSRPKFSLSAGSHVKLPIVGNFLMCDLATLPIKVQFDDEQETALEQGFELKPDTGFRSITVFNPNDSEVAVELSIGYGAVTDKRVSIAGFVETGERAATVLTSHPTVTIPAGQVAQVLAANSGRRSLLLRNLSTTGRVWVKDGATTTAQGVPLEGLDAYSAALTSPVFVYNQSGAPVEISAAELEK